MAYDASPTNETRPIVAAGSDGDLAGSGKLSQQSAAVRRAFVTKVYALLMLQLLFTFGLSLMLYAQPDARRWVQQNVWLTVGGLVLGSTRYLPLTDF